MLSLSKKRAVTTAILLLAYAEAIHAQNCYYPDGTVSDTDGACLSDGGACCPYQWDCISNGLCNYPQAGFYGRYTCTDQTWQSGSCPQFCTEGNTASGNEALLQCADGSWCCDGDRSFNCCTTADMTFFNLPQGSQVAFISAIQSPSSVPSPASSNSPASTSEGTLVTPSSSQAQTATSSSEDSTFSTSASSTATSPATQSSVTSSTPSAAASAPQSSTPSSHGASTVTSQAITTNTDGAVSTIVLVSTVSAASAPTDAAAVTSSSHSSPTSHLGLIIGLAVGIPVFLLACAIMAALFWRRRKANRGSYVLPPNESDDRAIMTDKYGHQVGHMLPDGRAPELDSYPVALGRSKSGHKSELEGSLHSPAMSTGTAGSRVSGGPPGYSPMTPNLSSVQEEPAELWGGYVPYRPPRAELSQVREDGDG